MMHHMKDFVEKTIIQDMSPEFFCKLYGPSGTNISSS